MYESRDQPLLPAPQFRQRVLLHVLYAALLMAVTVAAGTALHIWLEAVDWHDALLNTALIVSGIGPFLVPETVAGKLVLSVYSMFVGLVFMATLGIVLAPVAHRIIHKFHLDEGQD